MKQALTAGERRLVDYLRARQDRGEVGPTFRQMAVGIDTTSISYTHRLVTQLVDKGWVVRGGPKSRQSVRLIAGSEPVAAMVSTLRACRATTWINPDGTLMVVTGDALSSERLQDAIEEIVGG